MEETSPSNRPAWTYAALPGAIMVAALLLSGTYLFTHQGGGFAQIGGTAPVANAPKTGTVQFGLPELKKWAGGIRGLDNGDFNVCIDSEKYATHVTEDQQTGITLGVQGTPGFFVNGEKIEGAQPFSVFQAAIEDALLGPASSLEKERATITISAQDHILGEANAPVTIVEYSDFQCPYCRNFFEATYGQIKKQYVDTGKVRFVYRHFPLDFHPAAQKSAEAVECAGEQNKFWEMHDAIFTEQVK